MLLEVRRSKGIVKVRRESEDCVQIVFDCEICCSNRVWRYIYFWKRCNVFNFIKGTSLIIAHLRVLASSGKPVEMDGRVSSPLKQTSGFRKYSARFQRGFRKRCRVNQK